MSLPYKNTGDQVAASDYNAIVDGINNTIQRNTFDGDVDHLVNGEKIVPSDIVLSNSTIILRYGSITGTPGMLVTLSSFIVDNTSFKIQSLLPDGTVNTADNSTIKWLVIR